MPFACCLCCGNVIERARDLPEYGKPAGPCPSCGRTMYSTEMPFAELAVRQRASAARARPEPVSSPAAWGARHPWSPAASTAFYRPA